MVEGMMSHTKAFSVPDYFVRLKSQVGAYSAALDALEKPMVRGVKVHYPMGSTRVKTVSAGRQS